VTTSGSAGTMSLVGFRINSNNTFYPNTPVMERFGENLTWGGTPDTNGTTNPGGMVFLTNPLSATSTLAGNWSYILGAPPYQTQTDTGHFQLLSDMVFRMEFCFLLKSGTYAYPGGSTVKGATGYSNAPTALPFAAPYVTSNYFTGSNSPDLAGNVYGLPPDLGGIVVTIAVLDNTTRKILPSGGLASLGAALNDSIPTTFPSGINATPGDTTVGDVYALPPAGTAQTWQISTAQIWQSQLQQSGFAQSLNIPQIAVQQVRVYERTFYLDAN